MTTRIPLAGVIGSPIGHSKSPQIHKHWLKTLGLPGDYIPMEVDQADLSMLLQTLNKASIVG